MFRVELGTSEELIKDQFTGFKNKVQRTLDSLSKKVVEEHTKLVSDMQRVTEMTSKQISLFINKQHHPGMFANTRDAKSPDQMITQDSLINYGAGLQTSTPD